MYVLYICTYIYHKRKLLELLAPTWLTMGPPPALFLCRTGLHLGDGALAFARPSQWPSTVTKGQKDTFFDESTVTNHRKSKGNTHTFLMRYLRSINVVVDTFTLTIKRYVVRKVWCFFWGYMTSNIRCAGLSNCGLPKKRQLSRTNMKAIRSWDTRSRSQSNNFRQSQMVASLSEWGCTPSTLKNHFWNMDDRLGCTLKFQSVPLIW